MSAVVLLLGVISVHGVFKDQRKAQVAHELRQNGIPIAAELMDSNYDAGAGDPGGWTTDTVRFTTESGTSIVTTVGHHNSDEAERATGRLDVIYDPARPQHAMTQAELADLASPGADLAVGLSVTTLLVVAALAALVPVVRIHRP